MITREKLLSKCLMRPLDKIIETYDGKTKLLITARAGSGKTTRVVEYMSTHQDEGIIYVAQTTHMLDDVYKKLTKIFKVPEFKIFNWHTNYDSEYCGLERGQKWGEVKELLQSGTKTIVLTTHARLLFESPQTLGLQSEGVGINIYNTLILDESLNSLITATIPISCIEGVVNRAFSLPTFKEYKEWVEKAQDLPTVGKRARDIYNAFLTYTKNNLVVAPETLGIVFNDEMNRQLSTLDHKTEKEENKELEGTKQDRIKNVYLEIAKQIATLQLKQEEGDRASCIVPISLQFSWYRSMRNFYILDATGILLKGLYPGFEQVDDVKWNLDKINMIYSRDLWKIKDEIELNRTKRKKLYLSKTNLINDRNCGMSKEEFREVIIPFLQEVKKKNYTQIYLSTFKTLLNPPNNYNNSIMPLIREVFSNNYIIETSLGVPHKSSEKVLYIQNYGKVRGVNDFRNCEAAVLIGDYKLNPDVVELYNLLSDLKLTRVRQWGIQMSNFLQEVYRTRIRQDLPIDIYSISDNSFSGISEDNNAKGLLSWCIYDDDDYKWHEGFTIPFKSFGNQIKSLKIDLEDENLGLTLDSSIANDLSTDNAYIPNYSNSIPSTKKYLLQFIKQHLKSTVKPRASDGKLIGKIELRGNFREWLKENDCEKFFIRASDNSYSVNSGIVIDAMKLIKEQVGGFYLFKGWEDKVYSERVIKIGFKG